MLGDYLSENLRALGDWLSLHRTGLVRFATIVLAAAACVLTVFYLTPSLLALFAPKLDLTKDLYSVNRPVAFTFVDANGETVGHRGAIVGDRLKLDEMPAYLPAAFIAMEDRSFYHNQGIDVRGLVRAFWANFRAGHVVQGGSTITQQTAKIVFLNPKRTYSRKLEELFDAAALAKSLSKQQILEVYLNRIYLGSGAYGVDGAAHVYFGKSARDVTLAEAAMLATLTAAPSANSPRRDLEAAQLRANIVLNAMLETGAITPAEATQARDNPAVIHEHGTADARNFFLDTAADEALKDVSENGDTPSSDLVVHTTLVPRLQDAAQRAVAKTLAAHGAKLHASQSAVVLMKTDGAVAALVGGRNYDASSYNRATQAKRQPGSAFKPFVYLAAIESGMSPWDERDGAAVDIDGWTPTNYGGRTYGTVTLADALAHSINTVTAGLAQEVGVTTVVDAAHRCGIVSQLEPNASLALGTSEVTPLELTTAYGTFASGGDRVWPYFVTEVDDSAQHVLWQRKAPAEERVVASHVDRDMTAMLAGVVTIGTGRGAAIAGHEAAGKTGTTQDYHDAWFVGFTTDYVAGVWVGNDDSSPMKGVTGGTLPATIWKQVMTAAEAGLPAKPLAKSAPEAPTDDEDATTEASAGDDEATGGGVTSTTESDSDQPQQSQAPQDNSGNNRSFWDWAFGNRQQAAPARAAVPPRTAPRPDGADSADAQDQPPQADPDDDNTPPPPPAQAPRSLSQPPPPPDGPPPAPPPGVQSPPPGNADGQD
jgi:penicillin-binding protein 1A